MKNFRSPKFNLQRDLRQLEGHKDTQILNLEKQEATEILLTVIHVTINIRLTMFLVAISNSHTPLLATRHTLTLTAVAASASHLPKCVRGKKRKMSWCVYIWASFG